MPKTKVSVGQKFHKLKLIKINDQRDARGRVMGWFECDCPSKTIKLIRITNVTSNNTRSCGCIHSEIIIKRNKDNKKQFKQTALPEYKIWITMKQRCYNPKVKGYHRYGGRGIKVCHRWLASFEHFYEDMGPRPSPEHSLDRFPDNDGDYEKENCRWSTRNEQQNNRSANRILELHGERHTLTEWSIITNIGARTLISRIDILKWSVEDALTIPRRPRKPNNSMRNDDIIDYNGVQKRRVEWVESVGISVSQLNNRLNKGWDLERALSTPMRRSRVKGE